jgi:hypothetical protein
MARWLLMVFLEREPPQMNRLMIACAILAATPATVSFANPYRTPPSAAGHKGTITAWDLSQTRVIEHRFCSRTRGSWDYVACGTRVRDEVKDKLCANLGPGTHRYLYQVGDSKPSSSSVYCRR